MAKRVATNKAKATIPYAPILDRRPGRRLSNTRFCSEPFPRVAEQDDFREYGLAKFSWEVGDDLWKIIKYATTRAALRGNPLEVDRRVAVEGQEFPLKFETIPKRIVTDKERSASLLRREGGAYAAELGGFVVASAGLLLREIERRAELLAKILDEPDGMPYAVASVFPGYGYSSSRPLPAHVACLQSMYDSSTNRT